VKTHLQFEIIIIIINIQVNHDTERQARHISKDVIREQSKYRIPFLVNAIQPLASKETLGGKKEKSGGGKQI
jgi:hypothetical protein